LIKSTATHNTSATSGSDRGCAVTGVILTCTPVEPKTTEVRSSIVFALLLAVACKRDPNAAPPCGAVGARLFVLARADLDRDQARYDEASRRLVLDQLPAMRDSLVNACTDTKWSDAVRRCLVDAVDHLAFEACQQQLTDSQRQALERSAKPKASP